MADEQRKKADRRDFTTAPVSVLDDTRLSALDIRSLMVIALHDGMSLKKGSGAGCYATYRTLSAKVGTDITNFSKAVSRLCKLGYVLKERQQNDARRFTLRVVYGAPQTAEGEEIVGETTNHPAEELGEPTNNNSEIVGEGDLETHGNPPKTDPHYISLKEEIDFDESSELDSVKTARIADRDTRHNDVSFSVNELVAEIFDKKKDRADARLGRGHGASIKALMPPSWFELSPEAQLSHFERAYEKLDRDPEAINPSELAEMSSWLFAVQDNFAGEPTGYRAERILAEIESNV